MSPVLRRAAHVVDRARRLEAGLAGRGFEGDLRVLDDERPSSPRFVAASVVGLTALVAAGLTVRATGYALTLPW